MIERGPLFWRLANTGSTHCDAQVVGKVALDGVELTFQLLDWTFTPRFIMPMKSVTCLFSIACGVVRQQWRSVHGLHAYLEPWNFTPK